MELLSIPYIKPLKTKSEKFDKLNITKNSQSNISSLLTILLKISTGSDIFFLEKEMLSFSP